ncbi:Uncharacterised protein [Mycobacteroides abscessus subsp. abscessus]|nr:Uncharacterised protein [Mycobacteroides abscessus subsp. abscessus]
MLPWLTTVLVLTFLPLSASNSGTAYPVGNDVMILLLLSVSGVTLFRSSRTCCSRSSIWAPVTFPALIWAIATDVSTW